MTETPATIPSEAPRRLPAGLVTAATVVGALALFALVRALQLHFLGAGMGNDVHLYHRYAAAWGGGQTPYLSFQVEYPPGALPIFVLPWLYGGPAHYVSAFAIEMGIFDLAAYLLVFLWGRRLRPERRWVAFAVAGFYLVLTAALYPILYTRYDLVPGGLVLAALTLAYTRTGTGDRLFAGAVVLGVAAAVKLWPLALGPTFLLLGWRRGGVGKFFATGVGIAVGILICFGPLLPTAGASVLKFLEYHAARGIQIGSLWASVALVLNLLHVYDAWVAHNFGAFHVQGPAADAYARWSLYVLPLAVLFPQVGAFFGRLGRQEDDRGEVGLRVALATALGFIAFGKVLSPQFQLWIMPLLPLACRNVALALAALAIAVGTTVEYPFVAKALEMRADGHARAVWLVATRNALLVVLFAWFSWVVGWGAAVRRAVGWGRARWLSRQRPVVAPPAPVEPPPPVVPAEPPPRVPGETD